MLQAFICNIEVKLVVKPLNLLQAKTLVLQSGSVPSQIRFIFIDLYKSANTIFLSLAKTIQETNSSAMRRIIEAFCKKNKTDSFWSWQEWKSI